MAGTLPVFGNSAGAAGVGSGVGVVLPLSFPVKLRVYILIAIHWVINQNKIDFLNKLYNNVNIFGLKPSYFPKGKTYAA